jgi:hypothetical protein
MATTFVVITVTALLMVLSSGSGEPEPSMTLSHRYGQEKDSYELCYDCTLLEFSWEKGHNATSLP